MNEEKYLETLDKLIVAHTVFGAMIFALGCTLLIIGKFLGSLACVIVLIITGLNSRRLQKKSKEFAKSQEGVKNANH